MAGVRDYVLSIRLPFFMRKKFLLILSIVVLVFVLIAIVWTWMLYEEAVQAGRTIRWKYITQPFSLPLIILGIYAIFVLLWLAVKLKGAQGAVLSSALHLVQPQDVKTGSGEKIIGTAEYTDRRSGGSKIAVNGSLTITNQRFIHSPIVSAKRLGTLVGMQEPDVTFSLVHNRVRQCGYGLDPDDASRFALIEMDGTMHSFHAMRSSIEPAMRELGWKETRAGELMYWIR